jgi:N-acetylneuraminic acid mutarotase
MYVFGGEFATAWQFHHYRDLWRFDLDRNVWEALDTPTGPSPRSGHRMVVWKHFLVLFGGFYEASRGTKWFNDLWVFSLRTLKWNQIQIPSRAQQPSARSGFVFAAHPTQDMVYLYGGYSKVSVSQVAQRGRRFEDMWRLNLSIKGDSPWPVAKWDAVPVKGKAPVQRSGVAVSVHRNRIVVFGGVTDNETKNDVEGEFHNSMFTFDMDRARWFPLELRKKKKGGSGGGAGRRRRRGGGDDTSTAFTGHDSQAYDAFEDDDANSSDDDDEQGGNEDLGFDDNSFYFIIDGKMVKVEADPEEDAAGDGDAAMTDKQISSDVEGVVSGVAEVDIHDGSSSAPSGDVQMPPTPPPNATEAQQVEQPDQQMGGEETKQSVQDNGAAGAGMDVGEETTDKDVSVLGASEEEKEKQALAAQAAVEEEARAPEPRISAHTVVVNNKLYVYGGCTERGNKQITFDDMWVVSEFLWVYLV